jgi:AhpD family alkylhydroperoxidase
MARLPYARLADADKAPLVERIVAERGSVLHLYQMLLHSPPLAEGWLAYLTAVRHKLTISGALRELIIMRVAVLNGAPYEATQHAPIALQEGVTAAQLDALQDWSASTLFSSTERAVLQLTDAMTRDIHFAPEIMAAVREALGDRGAVEATATIASYNMVSRFLEALHIHGDDPR